MSRTLQAIAWFALMLGAVRAASAAMPPGWTTPEAPFRIAGNTWYVGTRGITVLLIRGDAGAILIDTGVPEAVPQWQASLARLGVEPGEIRLILTSHAHYDHVGALAQVKALTGARVLASAETAALLAAGGTGDLHFADAMPYPAVLVDDTVADGQTLHLGNLSVTAHATPGHTPGSTSWSWNETGAEGPITMVYADSLTAPGYRLIDHPARPQLIEEFRASFARIAALPCERLVTPHPEASNLFERMRGQSIDDPERARASDCAGYAARASEVLERQIVAQRREAAAPR